MLHAIATAAAVLGYAAGVFLLCLIHPILGVLGIGSLALLGSAPGGLE